MHDSRTRGAAGSPGLLKHVSDVRRRVKKRTPGRPTADQSERLRETMLAMALNAFMKNGFNAASIEAIAQDAKVAKITVYRQFNDKEELFREVVHYANTKVQQQLRFATEVEGDAEVVLWELIAGVQEAMTHPDYLALVKLIVSESSRFPDIANQILEDAEFALEPLINYLKQLRDEKGVQIDSPRESAMQMAALAIGGVRYLIHTPSSRPRARKHRVDAIYNLFARSWGLAPVER